MLGPVTVSCNRVGESSPIVLKMLDTHLPFTSAATRHYRLAGQRVATVQKTSTAAVWPGAAAILWSRVIKGAFNTSASAT